MSDKITMKEAGKYFEGPDGLWDIVGLLEYANNKLRKARDEKQKKVDRVWWYICEMLDTWKEKTCNSKQVMAELEIVFKTEFPEIKREPHFEKLKGDNKT